MITNVGLLPLFMVHSVYSFAHISCKFTHWYLYYLHSQIRWRQRFIWTHASHFIRCPSGTLVSHA